LKNGKVLELRLMLRGRTIMKKNLEAKIYAKVGPGIIYMYIFLKEKERYRQRETDRVTEKDTERVDRRTIMRRNA
jgi:hypothetical protein